MTRLGLAGLALVTLLVPTASACAASRSATASHAEATRAVAVRPTRVLHTSAPIVTLGLGGPRVAYASAGRVYIWNVATGGKSVIKGEYSNANHSQNAAEVAIAGTHVAWIKRYQLGNTEVPQRLYTATVGGSAHRLRSVLGFTNTDCGSGASQIAGLVSSGTSLAVSTWKYNGNGTSHSNERLNLVTPTKLRPFAFGPAAVSSTAADAGHIAVVPLESATMGPDYCEVSPSTTVDVFAWHGSTPHQVATGPSASVAISGKRLFVLTPPCFAGSPSCPSNTPSPVLDVYDWSTGALVHTWPVVGASDHLGAHDVGHVQAYGRLVFYSVYRKYVGGDEVLHLLDPDTGKDLTIATVRGYGDNRAWAIGPRGLVYVVNSRGKGELVFVAIAKLLALVG